MIDKYEKDKLEFEPQMSYRFVKRPVFKLPMWRLFKNFLNNAEMEEIKL